MSGPCENCGARIDPYPGMVEAFETMAAMVCEECWGIHCEAVAEEESGE